MLLPDDLTLITVTGTYPTGAGGPMGGCVTFTPSNDLTDQTGLVILRAAPVTVNLDGGKFSIMLPCTDNENLIPTGWVWNFAEYLTGPIPTRAFPVLLPSTLGESVDVSKFSPASPLPPASTVITTTTPIAASGTPEAGNVLTATSSSTASWEPGGGGGGTPSSTVQAATSYGIGSAPGTASAYSRGDHQHGTPSAPPGASTSAAGVIQIDGTAAHIEPVGVGAAGSLGLAADSGHTHPYEPWQFYVKAYGAAGDNATDDTAAIRAAVAAAFNYAVANHGYAEILLDPATYLLASAPITGAAFNGATFLGSAQLPIPAQPQSAQHLVLAFVGTRDQTALYNWEQTTPQRAGAVLRSTWAAGASLPATGEVSVIGGPSPHFMGDPPSSWSNVQVVMDGVSIEVPTNPQICGADFRCMGSANLPNAAVLALSASTGAPQIPDPNWAFGVAMPLPGNNDQCNIGNFSCEGLVIGLQVYEHVQGANVRLINCYDGLVAFSGSGFPHRNHFDYVSIENCVNLVVLNGGFNKLDINCLDVEWGSGAIVKDVSTTPAVGRIGIASNGNSGASLSAAMSSGATAVDVVNGTIALEITNLDQAVGPVTPPTIPSSGTALLNPFWRNAQIHLAGGTVTEVAIDGVNQLSTSGAFTVPSGHSITLTYSGTPSWAWTLVP